MAGAWFVPSINDFVSLNNDDKKIKKLIVKKKKKAKLLQGHIRYIGPLLLKAKSKDNCNNLRDKIYFGIELDTADGKNNGSVDGHKYFQCKKDFGLFVQRNRIHKIVIKHKSFEYKLELIISHFLHKAINLFPLEIYQLILLFMPPQKLYFTKDQRGINWFKVHKSRLKIFTQRSGIEQYEKVRKNQSMWEKYREEQKNPKIALLRFKDNSIASNDVSVVHNTFPIRHWKYCSFHTFELRLSLKCISVSSGWVNDHDSCDGSEFTSWPKFLILNAFKANEYEYKEKKILLRLDLRKTAGDDDDHDLRDVQVFGERLQGGGQWRYWVVSTAEKSDPIESKQAIEIGFQFPWDLGKWCGANSNIEIVKQRWLFHG